MNNMENEQINIDEFNDSYNKLLDTRSKSIVPDKIEVFCDQQCDRTEIISPQIISDFNDTYNNIRYFDLNNISEIEFNEYSNDVGYKSLIYKPDKLTLLTINDEEIIIIGDKINIKIQEIIDNLSKNENAKTLNDYI